MREEMMELMEKNKGQEDLLERMNDGMTRENKHWKRVVTQQDWSKMADRFMVLENQKSPQPEPQTNTREEIERVLKWRALEKRKANYKESLKKLEREMLKFSKSGQFLSLSQYRENPRISAMTMASQNKGVILRDINQWQQLTQSLSQIGLTYLLFQNRIKSIQFESSLLLIVEPENYYIFISL